jgi:tryptophan synthase beta chain
LSQQGRVTPESATDDEVTDAFSLLMKTEGIIPALESAHGLAGGFKRAKNMKPDQNIVINLSGRGDKDIFNIARAFPQAEWTGFLQREAARSQELLAGKEVG